MPGDLDDFRTYVDTMMANTLEANQTARHFLDTLRLDDIGSPPWRAFPEPLWRSLRPAGRMLLYDTTVGTLPRVLREKMGLRWSTTDHRRLQGLALVVRTAHGPRPIVSCSTPWDTEHSRRLDGHGHGRLMTTLLPDLTFLMGESDDADQERVLDAALDAFLDFGIRRTSMGEIAKRSGVSPATLYRRFAGKDEVVWAVGRREARRLIAGVDAGVDPRPAQRIRRSPCLWASWPDCGTTSCCTGC